MDIFQEENIDCNFLVRAYLYPLCFKSGFPNARFISALTMILLMTRYEVGKEAMRVMALKMLVHGPIALVKNEQVLPHQRRLWLIV